MGGPQWEAGGRGNEREQCSGWPRSHRGAGICTHVLSEHKASADLQWLKWRGSTKALRTGKSLLLTSIYNWP